jgi:LmbE family N-acetylglucosaminyl deacetylase
VTTLVAFHAHPDDEVVLTGGTLAAAAAAGHRVVLVTATDGRVHNEDDDVRMSELHSSASILGVHRVECLGYADSGFGPVFYPDPPGRVRFARAEVEAAAQRLAAILHDEDAELLLSYQPNGGYGHRDHVQVHRVGKRAAELAGTRVLEVTMPRELLRRVGNVCRLLRLPAPYDAETVRTAYAPQATITHRIDVRRFARQKRDAFAAHRSQIGGGLNARLFGLVMLLPSQLFGMVLSHEWFVEPGVRPDTLRRNIFDASSSSGAQDGRAAPR